MPPNPAQTSLIYVSFSVVALYGPALLLTFLAYRYLLGRKTRLERRLEKHRRIREDIAAKGQKTRTKLALRHQRRNIREMAVIVREQLEANKRRMTPYMHQRTSVFIEKAITDVDFDRLAALNRFFANAGASDTPPVMELFFEQTR
ncbi:conserved hypothetical protein [Solidesulfovibrio fructosivorans JJ]]|uniref:Uncharacterized protein n=1 Tax=Solidesulfovibrio fructosivorans JJ] TaxID=596151 RepID=E1JZY0_SOLFR|nr:hypothetical protein [Solidesulfovibrio fructosivorans]EFL50075.1 conserved hypothetical protein [Solidesulfovibrio fructosivorans JJ]]